MTSKYYLLQRFLFIPTTQRFQESQNDRPPRVTGCNSDLNIHHKMSLEGEGEGGSDSVELFRNFLIQQNIIFEDSSNLKTIVRNNFVRLTQDTMRLVITEAIKYRDSRLSSGTNDADLLSGWGDIIDTLKVYIIILNLAYPKFLYFYFDCV